MRLVPWLLLFAGSVAAAPLPPSPRLAPATLTAHPWVVEWNESPIAVATFRDDGRFVMESDLQGQRGGGYWWVDREGRLMLVQYQCASDYTVISGPNKYEITIDPKTMNGLSKGGHSVRLTRDPKTS